MAAAYCAIDFGTSNSAVALPRAGGGVPLVALEGADTTMPTAVFYAVDEAGGEPSRSYGRAALAAYVDGLDGRLMRSMKSILGSSLVEQHTDIGGGRSVAYLDVVAGYLRRLKRLAEAEAGASIERVVLGRPVFFVDDDPARDRAAQAALDKAARRVGFTDVRFQYEPIAAALDYERGIDHESLVLVADIGGGTSDFSLVRVGPGRRERAERHDDILANHGVHVAGTDFDRRIELDRILPLLGYRSRGPQGREVPHRVYFDLATWHLINTVYAPARVAELKGMRDFYADAVAYRRLMTVLETRLGHALIAEAESAKIAVADGDAATIALAAVEPALAATLDAAQALAAIEAEVDRIVDAARRTVADAGVDAAQVEVLYFTGGSTGFAPLADRIAQAFPQARAVRGDRFASVATGLGAYARRSFG